MKQKILKSLLDFTVCDTVKVQLSNVSILRGKEQRSSAGCRDWWEFLADKTVGESRGAGGRSARMRGIRDATIKATETQYVLRSHIHSVFISVTLVITSLFYIRCATVFLLIYSFLHQKVYCKPNIIQFYSLSCRRRIIIEILKETYMPEDGIRINTMIVECYSC